MGSDKGKCGEEAKFDEDERQMRANEEIMVDMKINYRREGREGKI